MLGNQLIEAHQIIVIKGCGAVASWKRGSSSGLPVARKPALKRPDVYGEHPGDVGLSSLA